MERDELRERIGEIITDQTGWMYNTGLILADEILALPEIKRGLELVKIAETIAMRKKEIGDGKR
jgi:hypothetical protein